MKLTFRFPYWLAATVFAIEATLRVLSGAYLAAGIWAVGAVIVSYWWRQEWKWANSAKKVRLFLSPRTTICETCGLMKTQLMATGENGSAPVAQIAACHCTKGDDQ